MNGPLVHFFVNFRDPGNKPLRKTTDFKSFESSKKFSISEK